MKTNTKTTLLDDPEFQTLPEGVKQAPLVSEAHFSRKVKPGKRPLTFGDFVAAVYQTWGNRQAKGIVQLSVKMHVVEFCGAERFLFS